ncbi:MAG: hypothetical protein AAF441_26340 [Pseudomonadota bacterium]
MARILFALIWLIVLAAAAHADETTELDIRLLAKDSLKTSDGCSFGVWQSNRDPAKDKYAYVLYRGFHDAHPLPALVKIGKKVIELEKVDPGLEGSTVTDKLQLFHSSDRELTVLLEVLKSSFARYDTIIDKARLTFIQRGKLPFVMTVKGAMSCTGSGNDAAASDAADAEPASSGPVLPANLDPNGIKLGKGRDFSSLKKIPAHIARLAADLGESCDVASTPGAGASYPISDAMTLWQLPCALYASNASSVFATALNGTPHAILLEVPDPKAESGGEPGYDILNAVVTPGKGLITSTNINAAGNCGSVDIFQLVEADGESVELKLLETRHKEDCKGPAMEPHQFPLTYRAKN